MEGISCILTTFNDAVYLEEGINSLNHLNNVDYELIIVDDGSTDQESLQILKNLEQKGFKVIHKENGGVGSARNLGIKQAKFDYVIAIDGDDKMNPEFLLKAFDILNRNAGIDIIYGNVQRFGTSRELVKPGKFDVIRLLTGNFISVSAIYRRKVWELTGGYNEDLPNYEDWDFWLKCAGVNANFHYLDETGLFYRKRDGSKIQRVAQPGAREKVVANIARNNKELYAKYLSEVIGKLHFTITEQQHSFNERLETAGNADKSDLLSELDRLKRERAELVNYYEGSFFWKLKLFFNKFFKPKN